MRHGISRICNISVRTVCLPVVLDRIARPLELEQMAVCWLRLLLSLPWWAMQYAVQVGINPTNLR